MRPGPSRRRELLVTGCLLAVRLDDVIARRGRRVRVAPERANAERTAHRPPGKGPRPGNRLQLVEWATDDADFESLRDDPEFQQLTGA